MKKSYVIVLFLLVIILTPLFGQWQADFRMTYSDSFSFLGYNNTWNIAVSGDTVHIIYTDKTPGKLQIFYTSSYNAGLSWNTPIMLSNDVDNLFEYTLAVSSSNVHVVWVNGSDQRLIYRRSTNAGVTWSSEDTLVYTINGIGRPCLAVNGNNVYLVFGDTRAGGYNSEIYFIRSIDNGVNWSTEQRLTTTPSNMIDHNPSLAINGTNLHLTWDRMNINNYTYRTLYLRSINSGTSWETETFITSDTTSQSQPAIAVSGNNINIVWCDERFNNAALFFRYSSNNGTTWQSETCLTANSEAADFPTIATVGENVHIAWRDYRNDQYNIGYRRTNDNGLTWSQETLLTEDAAGQEGPSIACAGSKVHLIWMDERDGNWEIYYKRNPTGSGIEETEIARVRNVQRNDFVVYPNPARSCFTIRLSQILNQVDGHLASHQGDKTTLKIFDVTGKVVMEVKLPMGSLTSLSQRISLDGIKNGIYFVQAGNEMKTNKLIITK